ncbi:hypothetical protein [Streptomyces sp. NPDC057702]|uniref:hypothetical protein n=1 Tax=unclassified Streptomyces TaxID=2593676 RepID=UPI003691EA68
MSASEPDVTHSTTMMRLYQHAVREGGIEPGSAAGLLRVPEDEAGWAVAQLRELGLLRPMSIAHPRLVAINPQTAAAERVGPREHALRAQQSALALQRAAIEAFTPVHLEAAMGQDPAEGVEVVDDPELLHKMITELAEVCQTEARVIQPFGLRTQEEADRGLPTYLELLGRGVRQRTLCQHSTRYSGTTKRGVAAMSAAGAEVRTLDVLPPRLIVFDRSQAILPGPDDGELAVIVRNAAVARYAAAVFDLFWMTAAPFHGVGQGVPDREISRDIDSAITRLLATGAKDEVIARRLGVSLRTCRRRIAHLMDDIGADSRFQAGYLARKYEEEEAAARATETAASPGPGGVLQGAVRAG